MENKQYEINILIATCLQPNCNLVTTTTYYQLNLLINVAYVAFRLSKVAFRHRPPKPHGTFSYTTYATWQLYLDLNPKPCHMSHRLGLDLGHLF
jgi:hypothetical protein